MTETRINARLDRTAARKLAILKRRTGLSTSEILRAALEQFHARTTRDQASAKLILLGFSGTGSLVGRFAEYAPDRVLAIIAANPGHNPLGLETIELSRKGTAIPN